MCRIPYGKTPNYPKQTSKIATKKHMRTPTNTINKELRILKVKYIYMVYVLHFVNNCLLCNCPDHFRDYFVFRNVGYNFRRQLLNVPRWTTNLGSTSVRIHGATLWSTHIDICEQHGLKRSLKKRLTAIIIGRYQGTQPLA